MVVMEVKLLAPYGYCSGVVLAMKKALDAKKEHPTANVYLLGNLVHNEEAVKELRDAGLLLIDERKTNLLDALLDLNRGDVVVFSAHGHPASYDDLAELKGLTLIDATCPFVKENTLEGQECGRPLIYAGVKGHLECEAFLANCPDAVFLDAKDGSFNYLKVKGKKEDPILICQTTLSLEEVERAKAEVLKFFPTATIGKERCLSTKSRQEAVLNLSQEEADALIVLGSSSSNNSVKLAEIGKGKGIPTFLCLGIDEVSRLDLSSFHKVALCSGASTSREAVLRVKDYLESL